MGNLSSRRGPVNAGPRALFSKLKELDPAVVEARTKRYLRPPEIKAVLARRDRIVACFKALIAAKGEASGLF